MRPVAFDTLAHGVKRASGKQRAVLIRMKSAVMEAKLRSAAKMIHDLEAKQPGLKQLLKSLEIGDNAMVASMLIQAAERWEIRKGGSAVHRTHHSDVSPCDRANLISSGIVWTPSFRVMFAL